MGWKKLFVHFGGHWENLEYLGGDLGMLPVSSDGLTYSQLVQNIMSILPANSINSCPTLYSLDASGSRVVKWIVKNDTDVGYLLHANEEPVVFVTLKPLPTSGLFESVGISRYGDGLPYFTQQLRTNHVDDECRSGSIVRPNIALGSQEFAVNLGDPDCFNFPMNVGGDGEQRNNEKGFSGVEGRRVSQSFSDYCGFRRCNEQANYEQFVGVSESGDSIADPEIDTNGEEIYRESNGSAPQPVKFWEIPVIDEEDAQTLNDEPSIASSKGLMEGSIYDSKSEFVTAVGMYHLHNSEFCETTCTYD